jgi:flagellar biosynthesis protein FlhA
MGLVVPPVRIRDNLDLEPESYSILIKGVEIGRGDLHVSRLMAMDSGDVTEKIAGGEFVEPVFGLNAIWIDTDTRDSAESRGYMVVDCPTIIATHLTELIKRHADEILGRQEVQQLIDNIKGDYPAVVNEINEKNISLGEVQKVLQNLLRERVSIRNMVTILETIVTYAAYTKDASVLTEYVRTALARQITKDHIDASGTVSVITVDPDIESLLRDSLYDDPVEGKVINIDPQTYESVIAAFADVYNKVKSMGVSPVFLVSPQIRGALFAMLERELPAPAVLSYSEIAKSAKVNVVSSALFSQSGAKR